jgi:hypothetical protein
MSYAYDAMGRRTIKMVQGGVATQFLYDGANAVQEAQGAAINPILVGLGVDEHFARNDVTGRTYFLTDAFNSTIALTDATGAIKEQYSPDPGRIGATHESNSSSENGLFLCHTSFLALRAVYGLTHKNPDRLVCR